MTAAAFATLLDRINTRPRKPGQVTAALCEAWREGGEVQRVIEVLMGWEIDAGRVAEAGDLRAIAARAGVA